jgi:3-methyl-2-oxobutanoate hydroxymethyltransferase
MKKKGKKIVMLTAYDAPSAQILSECGVDIILVGDSVGNALLGYESTVPVTLDDVIHHSAAVARAKPNSLIGCRRVVLKQSRLKAQEERSTLFEQ